MHHAGVQHHTANLPALAALAALVTGYDVQEHRPTGNTYVRYVVIAGKIALCLATATGHEDNPGGNICCAVVLLNNFQCLHLLYCRLPAGSASPLCHEINTVEILGHLQRLQRELNMVKEQSSHVQQQALQSGPTAGTYFILIGTDSQLTRTP